MGGGCRRGILTKTKYKYSLIFCAHALCKILSSWLKWFSSFNTIKRSNGEVRGITLPMFYGILNIDPKQSSEFQDPSSSNSLHIVLTRFFFVIKAKSKKGDNSVNVLQNSPRSQLGHLNINLKLYAKYQNPSSSISKDILLTIFFYCDNSKVMKGA